MNKYPILSSDYELLNRYEESCLRSTAMIKKCNWTAENKEYIDFISKYKIDKSIMSI